MIPRIPFTIYHFIVARWFRRFSDSASLARYQQRMMRRYFKDVIPRFPFYAKTLSGRMHSLHNGISDLTDLPIVDRSVMNDWFEGFNRHGISRERALQFALQAEQVRNFVPEMNGITIGLSSGTSGRRGVFLATEKERLMWAGIILAKALSKNALKQVLNPFRPALRIALFLRANSNLYTTIRSHRIRFEFYDLLRPLADHVEALIRFQPQIIVAPAGALTALSGLLNHEQRQSLRRELLQVFSAAEVLETHQKQNIEQSLGLRVDQIYQCTEGFLGITCTAGNLHLNEAYIYFEKEWIDQNRFYPILTDFTRSSQAFVRYRIDDILHIDRRPCSCGSASIRLAKIEGRADQILTATTHDGTVVPVFPDTIRQIFYSLPIEIEDYTLNQKHDGLYIAVKNETQDVHRIRETVGEAIRERFKKMGLTIPIVRFVEWQERPADQKHIRIRNDTGSCSESFRKRGQGSIAEKSEGWQSQ